MEYATGLLFGFVGSTLWFVSAETYVIVTSPSLNLPMLLVVCAACGQVAGFSVLYFVGDKLLRRTKRLRAKVEKFDVARFHKSSVAIMSSSSLIGLPPLAVVAIASGTIRYPYLPFVSFALAGRLIRFTLVLALGEQVLGMTCVREEKRGETTETTRKDEEGGEEKRGRKEDAGADADAGAGAGAGSGAGSGAGADAGAGRGDKRKDAESPREEASDFASFRLGALALKSSLAGADAGAGAGAGKGSGSGSGSGSGADAGAGAGADAASGVVRRERVQMGTTVLLSAIGETAKVDLAFDEAFTEIERFEAMASEFRPDSVISTLNDNAGKRPIDVPAELFALLERSVALSRDSDGAFDVTFLGRALVDYRRLRLDTTKRTAFLERTGMRVGLGAIGKGYAIDRAVAIFRRHGLTDFIAAASGDLFIAGQRAAGTAWQVGIQHPRVPSRIVARLAVRDRGVSTSGDYERFFIAGGRRYHHILDPRTGTPATGLASVTVVAPDTTTSDSLATAAFVLGPARALDFLTRHTGVDALLIDTRGRITMTPGLRALVRFEPPATATHAGGDFTGP